MSKHNSTSKMQLSSPQDIISAFNIIHERLTRLEAPDRYRAPLSEGDKQRKLKHVKEYITNEWFKATGLHFVVNLSYDEISSVSDIKLSLKRDEKIQELLGREPPYLITILDAFACVGCDTLSFMYSFPQADISAIQRCADATEKGRFEFLQDNVKRFSELTRCKKAKTFRTDIKSFCETRTVEWDVLYLDPPWILTKDDKLATSSELAAFLNNNVLSVLSSPPRLICFKVHLDEKEFRSEIDQYMKDYDYISTIAEKPRTNWVYFHFFTRR
jgi:hypothetical protein